jgi:hypothetical protein
MQFAQLLRWCSHIAKPAVKAASHSPIMDHFCLGSLAMVFRYKRLSMTPENKLRRETCNEHYTEYTFLGNGTPIAQHPSQSTLMGKRHEH